MGNLMDTSKVFETSSGKTGGLLGELFSMIPEALARPILEYHRTEAQRELFKIAIEAKKMERIEIMRTIQVLAEYNKLTPEILQYLMSAYCLPPISG